MTAEPIADVDAATPVLTARVFTEVDHRGRSVLVAIVAPETIPPLEMEELIDAFHIEESVWTVPGHPKGEGVTDEGFTLFTKPPLFASWDQVGFLKKDVLDQVLLDQGYADVSQQLDDIDDVRAFESQPVEIKITALGEPNPFRR